jgi:hypothetical protein
MICLGTTDLHTHVGALFVTLQYQENMWAALCILKRYKEVKFIPGLN